MTHLKDISDFSGICIITVLERFVGNEHTIRAWNI